jgi:hypothetical protein
MGMALFYAEESVGALLNLVFLVFPCFRRFNILI